MTLKEGKTPTLFEKFVEFKKLNYFSEKKKIISFDINQRFKFTDVKYSDYNINVIQIKEYEKNKGIKYFNIFITNIKTTKDNVFQICKAGRLRWGIENAFNKQKNLLFKLKHVYSKNTNASYCYHILLQISDLIFQFMSYTFNINGENILYKIFGSLKEFLLEIYISFRKDISNIKHFFMQKHLILIKPNQNKIWLIW